MHESHLRQAVRLPHAYTAEHLMRMRKARKENRTVHECPTFARLDAGDGCEEVAWVDHFQLALSHSLTHLPQLAWQVLGQRRRPAGAVHLCATLSRQHSFSTIYMLTAPPIRCIAADSL